MKHTIISLHLNNELEPIIPKGDLQICPGQTMALFLYFHIFFHLIHLCGLFLSALGSATNLVFCVSFLMYFLHYPWSSLEEEYEGSYWGPIRASLVIVLALFWHFTNATNACHLCKIKPPSPSTKELNASLNNSIHHLFQLLFRFS